MDRISSRQNSLVRRFRTLAHGGGDAGEMLLDGPHLLGEALECGLPLTVVAFAETAVRDRLAPLADRVSRAGVRTVVAPDAIFDALSPVQRPSGVVSIARRPSATLESALVPAPQLLLVLDGVQDPGNVGAIIRAAEAFGATGVIVGGGSADPFGWKALRGAMGSSFRLPVVAGASLANQLRALRAARVQVLVSVPRSGLPPADVDLRAPAAILLGGEGAGLADDIVKLADARVTVPMQPPVESLNVAVAAASILYEAARQRAHVAVR